MTGAYDRGRLEAALRRGGDTRRLEVRDEVTSTQDAAFTMADYGAPDGSLVVAERQTRARGRHGRTWASAAGLGVEFSMVIRPPAEPVPVPPLLVAATAVAAAEALERSAGLVPAIRWPNDLVVGDRKLAGILIETRDFEPRAPLFVLGVGLNAGQSAQDFPEEIREEATSVAREKGGAPPDRTALLVELIRSTDRWREALAAGAHGAVEEAFRARVAYLGRQVTLREGDEVVEGILESASPVAGIFLRLQGGGWRAVRPEHARDLRPA